MKKVTIYGKMPYFANTNPFEEWEDTANKLVEMGRATFEKEVKPWQKVEKIEQVEKETKVDEIKTEKKTRTKK